MSFTVYKSSAGSGKTFTLVKEYLNLVLPEPSGFRHILAITFTNKAANEMKERIINSLKEIAGMKDNPESKSVKYIVPDLSKSSGLSPQTLSANAEMVLKYILHEYSDFAISTIDSFVHRVIRSFAFDLHLPLNFDVEMDTDELMGKVIDILISRVGSDEELTRTLVNFIQSKTDDEKSWNVEHDLREISEYLLKEDGQEHLDKLKTLNLEDFYVISTQILEVVNRFEKTISGFATYADDIIKSKGIPQNSFYQGKNGIGVYFVNLSKGRFDKLEPNSYVRATIEEDKWHSGKASPVDKQEIDEIKTDLIDCYTKIIQFSGYHLQQYRVLSEIRKNIYPLAVLNEIAKVVEEYKTDNEILLISEFNKKISNIVLNEPVPFIYERMGEKYRHFLIDEFQDTSLMQWQNLLPLIENSLATNQFNMVVGDGKQAIYRWRGGEVEQFAGLPKIFQCPDEPFMHQRQKILERNYNPKFLQNNYRSKKEIVEFNNDFFTCLAERLPEQYQNIYHDVVQQFDAENTGGYIQFSFYDPGIADLTVDEFNLEQVRHTINELRADGFRLKDIAILCRNNKNAGFLSQELLKLNLPVVSSESLQLSSSPEVRLLIASMRLLVNPQDKIAQVEVVNYLVRRGDLKQNLHEQLVAFGLVVLNAEARDEQKDFFTVLAQNNIYLNVFTLKNYTLYDLTEELIRIFDFHKKADPYIQFFLDAVLKFSREQNEELADFIRWWDQKGFKQSIIVPSGIDAVQVMTIHKAKGLEFPVVIYPFAGEKHRKSKDKLWVTLDDKDVPKLKSALVNTSKVLLETPYAVQYEEENGKSLLDLINLLYVVMTRPTHRLYVIASVPSKSADAAESVPGFFKYYFEKKGIWDETKSRYPFGEKVLFVDKTKESTGLYLLDRFISNSWHDRMILSLQAVKNWDIDEQALKQQWGNLVHRILAQIATLDDADPVLEKFESDGIITVEEKESILLVIKKFLAHPDVSMYFLPGLSIKTEPEILLPDGKTFRPDRIVFKDSETIVIDFKTGKPEESHQDQVSYYMKLLREMGYSNLRGVLLYINELEPRVDVI
jgi:ATP-dependent exoDNAse (exonuclease V) beta subunit